MAFDSDMIAAFYKSLSSKVSKARALLGRPLTLAEKILYAHVDRFPNKPFQRGVDYVLFNPDRVAMQDATAQMALLQFMQAGKKKVAVPSTVHCDHLIQAKEGADEDLSVALDINKEVYDFLKSVSNKYGVGFWKPGAGIIHQVVLENYAFPGGLMIGTDSHTVNAGGLGMIAIGVGGADAVDVMAGLPWELKFPKLIGVVLKGDLSGWTAAKDVILKVAGILTVKGGTGHILEYIGPGADSLSATGKGTICNMGAEIGATTSLFAYDDAMGRYLAATDRADIAALAAAVNDDLRIDPEILDNPYDYYDQVIEIDLATLEPYINGPFSPDKAWPISEFGEAAKEHEFPLDLEVGLIGSCTNSSYEDLARAASIARQAKEKSLVAQSEFTITPGSEQVRYTVERDQILADFESMGGVVLANACGPCIGQWKRHRKDGDGKNSILTSFNRNFAKRNDGNPNTFAFVASPEIVTAMVLGGRLDFNPLTDTILSKDGEAVQLDPPVGEELPDSGFDVDDLGYEAPAQDSDGIVVDVDPDSDRLQVLTPFAAFDEATYQGCRLLIKAKGKCTTDHISMAGPWLKYRGHLDNISNNLLIGAVNYFNDETNSVCNQITGAYEAVPTVARFYKQEGISSIVVGDENYGEGSSREHAAMEPRHLGVCCVLVRSFARIHETNLKKQGVLGLTFANPADYDLILEDDVIDILDLDQLSPGNDVIMRLSHQDGSEDLITCCHTYNQQQIDWFNAGSALNYIKECS
ncbi:aconitate hydratase [bacterium]|nr:aconitate hydratase [bacterium]